MIPYANNVASQFQSAFGSAGYSPNPLPQTSGPEGMDKVQNPATVYQPTPAGPDGMDHTQNPAYVSTNNNTGPTAAQIAAAAKAAADAKVRAYAQDQASGAQAGLMQSGSSGANDFTSQGINLAGQLQTGQNAINQARLNIGVSQINSIKGLVDAIKSGLQSSRVGLGNTNAEDSSAADAISRIYSQYGNTQRNVINNDAAVKNADQDTQQSQLDLQREMGVHSLSSFKDNLINQISNQAQQQLSAIDGIAQLQGVSGAIDINAIKQAVVNNAQQKLADADAYIQSRLGAVTPTGADDIAHQAYDLSNRGVQGSGGTNFVPIQQGTDPSQTMGGATNFQLPLYTKPKSA